MARMNFTENYTRDSVLNFLIKSGFQVTEGTKNTDRIELTQPIYKTDLIVNYVHNPSFLVAIILYPEEMVLEYIPENGGDEYIIEIPYEKIFNLSVYKWNMSSSQFFKSEE